MNKENSVNRHGRKGINLLKLKSWRGHSIKPDLGGLNTLLCFFSPTIHVIFHINVFLHSYSGRMDLSHENARISLTPKRGLLKQRLQTGAQEQIRPADRSRLTHMLFCLFVSYFPVFLNWELSHKNPDFWPLLAPYPLMTNMAGPLKLLLPQEDTHSPGYHSPHLPHSTHTRVYDCCLISYPRGF